MSLKIPLGLNFVGRCWAGLVAFAALPFYLRGLGPERFGLVGFYLLLQAVLGFFSAGLADAANREMAARGDRGSDALMGRLTAFVRLAWLIGLGLGAIVAVLGGWLAHHWLTLDQVSPATATDAIRLMALLIAVQVPLDLYVGVFLGVRRPATANLILAGTATARAVAAVAVLKCGQPTIEAFFGAQIGVALVAALLCQWSLRTIAPGRAAPAWRETWSSLRGSLRFSAGMTGVAFTGMLLGQADRIVLSRTLRLDEFGLYSIAVTLANLLYFLIGPVQATYYPEFSRHLAVDQRSALSRLYHQASQRMAVLVMSAGAVLAFFSRDILQGWTAQAALAEAAAPVVALLVGARIIGGLNTMPYTLQFAHGWTSLVLACNTAAIVAFLPGVCYLSWRWGALGAAAGYFLLSLPFLGFVVWRMHRRLLPGELGRWLWRDTAPAVLAALVSAGAWRYFEPRELGPLARTAWLVLASGSTLAVAALATPDLRSTLLGLVRPSPTPRTG